MVEQETILHYIVHDGVRMHDLLLSSPGDSLVGKTSLNLYILLLVLEALCPYCFLLI